MDPTARSSRIPAWGRSSLTRFFSVRYIITLRYCRMLDRASGPLPLRHRKHNSRKLDTQLQQGSLLDKESEWKR